MVDIYTPPTSDIIPESKSVTKQGSIKTALNGEYHLDIKTILKEAWEKTKGVKGSIWLAFIISVIITYLLNLGLEFLLPTIETEDPMSVLGFILGMIPSIISGILLAPLFMGIMMIAIYRSSNYPYSYKLIFQFFHQYKVLIIASILVEFFSDLGFVLLILPGIYLSISYWFTLPLIGDHQLEFWQAMETSRKAITKHWFKVFGILFVSGLIVVISAIPLGIGLIWSLPFVNMISGVLYRDIFGVQGPENQSTEEVKAT